MKREVSLEEYYLLKPSDRQEFFDKMVRDLNEWEPSLRSKIDNLLDFGRNKRFSERGIATEDLLATIESQEIIHALRRNFTTPQSEERDENISMLVNAISHNYNFHFQTRLDTLKYYINNPRYTHTVATNNSLRKALSNLRMEAEDYLNSIDIEISKFNLENTSLYGRIRGDY